MKSKNEIRQGKLEEEILKKVLIDKYNRIPKYKDSSLIRKAIKLAVQNEREEVLKWIFDLEDAKTDVDWEDIEKLKQKLEKK